MTTAQVAKESGRHPQSVLAALRRGVLQGAQANANASWRVARKNFDDWMERGAPIDDPVRARLRRRSA